VAQPGQTLKDLERYDEAAAAMRRAVMLAPDYGPNHGVLGEILHHLGRLNSADVSLRRAIDLGCADDHAVWTVLGNNQRMLGHLDESLEMVTRALALAGGSAAAHSNVGVVLMQLGRFDESVTQFELAIEGDPENNGFRGYLGYALLAAGRLEEAFDPWERAIQGGLRGRSAVSRFPAGRDRCRRPSPGLPGAGIGDEIMLASMYPISSRRRARRSSNAIRGSFRCSHVRSPRPSYARRRTTRCAASRCTTSTARSRPAA